MNSRTSRDPSRKVWCHLSHGSSLAHHSNRRIFGRCPVPILSPRHIDSLVDFHNNNPDFRGLHTPTGMASGKKTLASVLETLPFGSRGVSRVIKSETEFLNVRNGLLKTVGTARREIKRHVKNAAKWEKATLMEF